MNQLNVKSAGIKNYAETPLTKGLIDWTDVIFVMVEKHKTFIQEKFKSSKKIDNVITLHIEDKYNYMDPKLVTILEEKLNPYV